MSVTNAMAAEQRKHGQTSAVSERSAGAFHRHDELFWGDFAREGSHSGEPCRLRAVVGPWLSHMAPSSDRENRARASQAVDLAMEHQRQGQRADAMREYERACELDPSSHIAAYNLGLLYKYAGEWERSLELNARAAELEPTDAASAWNLGIAATALGRWEIARTAWRAAGVEVPIGVGPVAYPCGHTPIRLNPETKPEVVWADRIDPARAVLRSIPLPESGFLYGDLVLNDGAPVGYRKSGSTEVPVFNCLARLEASPFNTWLIEVSPGPGTSQGDAQKRVEELAELATERSLAAEDWSKTLRILCRACSEGRPHSEREHHHHDHGGAHRIAIAARTAEEAESLLAAWQARSPGFMLGPLQLAAAGNDG